MARILKGAQQATLLTMSMVASVAAHAVDAATCPSDVASLNAADLSIEGTQIACDASSPGDGYLNECGVLRLVVTNYPEATAIIKENKAYIAQCRPVGSTSCNQGKFTPAFMEAKVRESSRWLWEFNQDSLDKKLPVDVVCRRLALLPPAPKKLEPVRLLSDRLSLTRDVSDPQNAAAKFEAPFMVNASEDREKKKSLIGLYGTAAYTLYDRPEGGSLTASAKVDSAAGSERAKSSVALALNWSGYTFPAETKWVDAVHFKFSPSYLTDRAFDREVYELGFEVTPTSKRIGRAGLASCWEDKGECNELSKGEFYWSPSLAIEAGHVADAAGVAKLEAIRQSGTYARLAPAVTMSYRPSWSERLTFSLKYTHRYDVTENWDRGLGSLGVDYAISTDAFLSVVWKKGRQTGSFEPVDMLLFGFGVRQLAK
jgi:hypothetical protein